MTNLFIKDFFPTYTNSDEKYFFSEIRQLEHLKNSLRFLESAYKVSSRIEILSEDLRFALKELESVSGNIDFEEKLDFVFKKFCIGK